MRRNNQNTLFRPALLLTAALALGGCADTPESVDDLIAMTQVETDTRADNGQRTTPDDRDGETRVQRRRAPGQLPPPPPPNDGPDTAIFPLEFRTIDGTLNNLQEPDWGSAETWYLRVASAAYADGASTPAGAARPSARAVSNAVAAQTEDTVNSKQASDYLWQWGQFLDHDITETPVADPAEAFDIAVPVGDPFFDPTGAGVVTIALDRSVYVTLDGVREQLNAITAYVDASNVYGAEQERALALRTLDGTGRLKTRAGDLLPFNETGLPNAPSTDSFWYLAGDIRANEQIALTALHTLFVREHNFWAAALADHTDLAGDEIYEIARALVAAEMQAITYREFLPVLLGPEALRPYPGYRAEVNAGITNEFAAAAYRVGHSMLSPQLLRRDANGAEIDAGDIALADAFFNPAAVAETGIAPILRGLALQTAQRIDTRVIDDVRNFLFGPPGAGGFDLASLNIQRGRDHGLASLNDTRRALGLPPHATFEALTDDAEVAAALAAVYASVEDVDLWVGGLAERHAPRALLGQTFHTIITRQFERLRDGDRFWYRRYLPRELAELVERQDLARIIRRNTTIGAEFPRDVWIVRAFEPPTADQAELLAAAAAEADASDVELLLAILAREPVAFEQE